MSLDLNVANVLAHLMSSGSWFQLREAKYLKPDSPCFVWTLGISNWLEPNDLSGLLDLYSVSIWGMYLGPRPLSDLWTSKSTLKSILNVTGSQCKDLRTGVICSDFLVLVRILAAAFWMSCSCLMVFFGRPVRRPLQ